MEEISWRIWLFLVIIIGGAIGLYLSLLMAVRRLRLQAPEWDAARQPALDQAMEIWQTGQQEAEALAAEYASVGEPYTTPYNRAQKSYTAALQAAEQALRTSSYPEAGRLPHPTGWRLLLIAPVLSERRARLAWLPELERIRAEVQTAQAELAAARQQAAALKDLGDQTRAAARENLEGAQALLDQVNAEARPAYPLEKEKTHLEESCAQIREFLNGPGCKGEVASAYTLLAALKPTLETIQKGLDNLRERRVRAEGLRASALQGLQTLQAEVEQQQQAGQPVETLCQSIQEWRARLEELENALQAGHYRQVIQVSREIGARVERAQADLQREIAERQRLASLGLQLSAESQETRQWLGGIPPFYQADTSLALLQKAETWLAGRQRQASPGENQEGPLGEAPVTPEELRQARQAFDRRRQIYAEQRPKLETLVPALQRRLHAALAWMEKAHPKYQAGLSLEGLHEDEQAMQAHWQAAFQRDQLRESELRRALDHLSALLQLSQRIEKALYQARQNRQLLLSEQEEARQAAAHPEWEPLAAALEKISQDGDEGLTNRARSAQALFQALRDGPGTPGVDYGHLARQAGQLRASLEKLRADYRGQLDKNQQQVKSLTEELMRLRNELLGSQKEPLLDFAILIEAPVQEIEKWLGQFASLPKSSLRSLSAYREAGERLRLSAWSARESLQKSKKRYHDARKRTASAITAAQIALTNTEKTLQNAPWYHNEGSSQIVKAYQNSLAEARRIFDSTGNPQQKTPAGEAIRLLEGPAYHSAQEARRRAEALGKEAEQQAAQIQALRNTLAQLNLVAQQRLNIVTDPNIMEYWQKVWWKNADAENALRNARSSKEAAQILIESIERVDLFIKGIKM